MEPVALHIFPWSDARGGPLAGHPQRPRCGRLLRGAALAAAAAAQGGRGEAKNETIGRYNWENHGKNHEKMVVLTCFNHWENHRTTINLWQNRGFSWGLMVVKNGGLIGFDDGKK